MSWKFCRLAALLLVLVAEVSAHESPGRIGHKETEQSVRVETDFFFGRRGYWHAGLGAQIPAGERRTFGLTTRLVREESGGEVFPSLGSELGFVFDGGVEVELFSFGYFPVEQQHAWAFGGRVLKTFELSHDVALGFFVSPVFARVRAFDSIASRPEDINHLMFFGGVMLERGPFEISIFGSQSVFNRDPSGLETHVDLEEMTHRAVYENNDGFARHSAGVEIDWAATSRLSFSVRYASIFLPDVSLRHSIGLNSSMTLNENWEVFAGLQLLRGGQEQNELLAFGFSAQF